MTIRLGEIISHTRHNLSLKTEAWPSGYFSWHSSIKDAAFRSVKNSWHAFQSFNLTHLSSLFNDYEVNKAFVGIYFPNVNKGRDRGEGTKLEKETGNERAQIRACGDWLESNELVVTLTETNVFMSVQC